jgi:hypothetical protein
MSSNETINEINYITSILITVFGYIGNSITIYILSRPKLRKISLFRYLIFSIINDFIVLLTMWICAFQWICESIGCKLSQYFVFLFYDFSGWIVVISLLDRFVSVKYPKKYKFRNSFKYQAIIVFLIFLILILIHIPFYLFYDVYGSNNTLSCTVDNIYRSYYLNLLSFLVGKMVPFLIMIVWTILTGQFLIQGKIKLTKSKSLIKEKKLIKMTVFISSVFFILNIPYYLSVYIYGFSTGNRISFSEGTPYIIYTLACILCYVYNSIGFLICFISNRIFRKYFFSLIRRK